MTRKFKALGLALIAVFAMSAVAASGAQAAEEHTFKSEVSPTNFTGSQVGTHEFTVAGGNAKTTCESAIFEGTETGLTKDEVTIVPSYDECESAPFGESTVTEHHCAYVFDSDTTTHGGAEEHAPVDIECSGAEGKITIAVPGAGVTITVGPQTDLHGVKYNNVTDENGKEAIEVEATVEGIAWNCSPAFLCTLGLGATSGTDGTYNGDTIVTGYEDNGTEQTGTAKTTPNLTHGDPVNVTMTTP